MCARPGGCEDRVVRDAGAVRGLEISVGGGGVWGAVQYTVGGGCLIHAVSQVAPSRTALDGVLPGQGCPSGAGAFPIVNGLPWMTVPNECWSSMRLWGGRFPWIAAWCLLRFVDRVECRACQGRGGQAVDWPCVWPDGVRSAGEIYGRPRCAAYVASAADGVPSGPRGLEDRLANPQSRRRSVMRVEDARRQLLLCLQAAGQEPQQLEPGPAWRAFGDFMHHTVEAAEDALLYEYGTFSFGGPRRFVLSFCRQFDVDEDGAQALIQVRCEIEYEPTPALEALGAYNQWWSGGEGEVPLAVVLDEVERRSEWEVIGAQRPAASSVYQERPC